MHRNRIELQNAYERIINSRSALDEFGEIVIENDGHWNPSEVTDPTKLIQLQLFNITASGIGAESALRNWMEKAVTTLRE